MKKGETPAQDRIDKKDIEKLCQLQCTIMEVSDIFDDEDDTLNRWCKKTYNKTFSEIFKVKRGKGQISLRRMQWQQAQKNATMAIWLGKQYLGQRDNIEVEHKDLSKVEELLSKIDKEAKNDNK